jgi:hypothetical protein
VWNPPLGVSLPLHLIAFFVSALLCHTTLYMRRPTATRLTEFYLFMSLGGVLGGTFCALLAPQLFSKILEYPVLLAAALFCRPGFFAGDRQRWVREASGVALVWAGMVIVGLLVSGKLVQGGQVQIGLLASAVMALAFSWRRPDRLAAPAVVAVLVGSVLSFGAGRVESVRSFFGVHKLLTSQDGRFLNLVHGTTVHGAIRLRNDDGTPAVGRPEPTTYYTLDGGMGLLIASLRRARHGTLGRVAVVGLGTGSLACHAAPAENWTFFEIDSEVIKIATTPRYFRFLSECGSSPEIVLGDARLAMAEHPGGNSLIIVDAFSSDAIPVHLITKEAIALYLSKLDPSGAIVVHISNRHLDLSRILARTAAEHGLATHLSHDSTDEPVERRYRSPSLAVVLARDPVQIGSGAVPNVLKRLEPDMARRPWTDDFSNIVQAIADKNGW